MTAPSVRPAVNSAEQHADTPAPTEQLTRQQVRAEVSCPRCHAGAGQPCQGARGRPRASQLHQERWASAIGKLRAAATSSRPVIVARMTGRVPCVCGQLVTAGQSITPVGRRWLHVWCAEPPQPAAAAPTPAPRAVSPADVPPRRSAAPGARARAFAAAAAARPELAEAARRLGRLTGTAAEPPVA